MPGNLMPTPPPIFLLNLSVQDRIVRYEDLGPSFPDEHRYQEVMYYVECCDTAAQKVHALDMTCGQHRIAFDEIIDIQPAIAPITTTVSPDIWALHQGDPTYLDRPVPVLAVQIHDRHQIGGLVVPKWPGKKVGQWLHLNDYYSLNTLSCDERTLLQNVPSMGFNPTRFGDIYVSRKRNARNAQNRLTNFITKTLTMQKTVPLPLDPSLKKQRGFFVEK
jgi:hypothetical protein